MERLTCEGNYCELELCSPTLSGRYCSGYCSNRKVWERLKAYEDTGLTPERMRWIPVSERLPEPETEVLAVCNRNGYIFVAPAIYENGKMLTQDSKWNWCDIYCYGLYSEDADDYYVPEGWWENRQFNPDDVYNNLVDCPVTHWMPLPEPPEVTE